MLTVGEGLRQSPDGSVTPGPVFAEVEGRWMTGVAAMAAAGAQVIIEDNFVSGPSAQQRWQAALGAVPAAWIGVRSPAAVAAERERARSDRATGMAAKQAELVHMGIEYDLEVDTSLATAAPLALHIRECLFAA